MDTDCSLSEWLEGITNNPFHIYIENSEVSSAGIMAKNVTLFTICWSDAQGNSGSLQRRYSEFETLSQILINRYRDLGIVIPPLPPKRLVHDAEFINSRKRGLTLFCQAVANNPFLRFDKFWEEFLKADNDLKEATKQAENKDTPNIGYSRYQQALAESDLPPDLARLISHLRTETTNLEKPLRQFLDASKILATATSTYSSGTNALFGAVDSLCEYESNEVTALNGLDEETKNQNAQSQSVPNLMSHLARMLSANVEVNKDFPIINSMLVSEVIDFEILLINELRSMIKYREEFVKIITQAERKLQQIEENQKSKQEQKDDQRNIVEKNKNDLNTFTKGLLLLTLPRIIENRNKAMRWIAAHICAVQFIISNTTLLACNGLFSSLEMSAYDAIPNANNVMTELLLPGLPDTNRIIQSITKDAQDKLNQSEEEKTAEQSAQAEDV